MAFCLTHFPDALNYFCKSYVTNHSQNKSQWFGLMYSAHNESKVIVLVVMLCNVASEQKLASLVGPERTTACGSRHLDVKRANHQFGFNLFALRPVVNVGVLLCCRGRPRYIWRGGRAKIKAFKQPIKVSHCKPQVYRTHKPSNTQSNSFLGVLGFRTETCVELKLFFFRCLELVLPPWNILTVLTQR